MSKCVRECEWNVGGPLPKHLSASLQRIFKWCNSTTLWSLEKLHPNYDTGCGCAWLALTTTGPSSWANGPKLVLCALIGSYFLHPLIYSSCLLSSWLVSTAWHVSPWPHQRYYILPQISVWSVTTWGWELALHLTFAICLFALNLASTAFSLFFLSAHYGMLSKATSSQETQPDSDVLSVTWLYRHSTLQNEFGLF